MARAQAAQTEAAAESEVSVVQEVRRLKESLEIARVGTGVMRRLLRRLAYDSPIADAVCAFIDAELETPGWPEAEVAAARRILAPLPNFAWLEPGRVAGCARPDTELAVRFLAQQGVRALISLDQPPPAPWLAEAGIEGRRIEGIADQAAPTPEQLQEAIEGIESAVAAGTPVAVHCIAGIGRTGTVLAAYLVRHGADPNEAIQKVRRVYHPRAVENAAQEAAVRRFAADVRREPQLSS